MFLVLSGVLTILCVWAFVDWYLREEEIEKIPGPEGYYLIGNPIEFLKDTTKLFYHFRYLSNKYKNIYKFKIASIGHVILYHPEDIEAVISGAKNSRKGFVYWFIKPWLQDGLLLSTGMKWQRRRKILTYAFHFKILQQFNTIMYENTVKLIEKLQAETSQVKTDIMFFINNFTLANITETAMGTKLDDEDADFAERYKSGIHALGRLIVYRVQRTWLWLDTLFYMTEAGKQQTKVLQLLTSFRDSVVDKRRRNGDFKNLVLDEKDDCNNDTFESGKKRLAMLDLLLHAEKDGTIDAKGIGEEVDTFMFEGHDTTAAALQYTLMLLANHQEAQDAAAAECEQILSASDKQPTVAELNQMKYLECCIKESLRLYPPVSFFSRYIDEETKLKNFTLPVGTDVTIIAYDLHRRDDQFVEPLEFRPERFQKEPTWHPYSYIPFSAGPRNCIENFTLPVGTDVTIIAYDLHRRDDQFVEPLEFRPERFQKEPTWHPYSYIPFSAGPRNCIGQKFAIMQMKLVLSAILRRYKLVPVTKPRDLVFILDFILRTRDPIYVKLEERHKI